MGNTSIRELAEALGLSIGTISKAMRDSHEISEATRKKVQEAARKFKYVPNPYASSLRKRRSKTIAVVLPEVADGFFSLAINGIESVAQDKGYHVLIYLTHESFQREEAILEEFKSGRVDGILISVSADTHSSDHIRKVMAANIPLVFFDRVCEDVTTTRIVTDDFDSSYKATSLLIKRGCRRIAYLAVSSHLSISHNRIEGYRKALRDHRIPADKESIVYCDKEDTGNYQLIKTLLRRKERPDAVLASVEKLTAPVYRACRELNLSIPGAIKVISFTNLPAADILSPALTTITQPAFEMGEKAAAVLFKALGKNKVSLKKETIVLPSVLTLRESAV
jgi:LacI family transcriptional regulator